MFRINNFSMKLVLQALKSWEKRPLFISKSPAQYFAMRACFSDDKKIRGKTPIGKLDQEVPKQEKESDVPDPYAPFPEGKNPATGEIGGPRGPEPTRYGDWERKGRVSDF